MKDILNEIIEHKRIEIETQKKTISVENLQANFQDRVPHSLRKALATSSTGIIAEFKRKSPSKGWINEKADPLTITQGYQQTGASALSILTDEHFFGGNLKDIQAVREHISIPILRKDFIIDEYQLYQARFVGADAILLIAAALSIKECKQLTRKAHELNLEVLLELHHEKEMEYITEETDIVGINNRNLGSFHTDVNHSFEMIHLLPSSKICVSESGISNPSTVIRLRQEGFKGFLIGGYFMSTENPSRAFQQFIRELR